MDDGDIMRVAQGFCTHSLPKAEWTHEAHFATALWLILRRPDLVPERAMPAMIRSYNESVGGVNSDSAGYHETITQASLHMTRHLLAQMAPDISVATALAALMASPLGDKDWLFTYWTRDHVMTSAARRAWVAPDIRPLP